MKFVPNMGKMGEIFDKSKREKFIKVVLKENNEVIFCKADNFIYLPLDEDSDDDCPEDITYIHVILKDGTNRLLTNEDIKKFLIMKSRRMNLMNINLLIRNSSSSIY